MTNVHASAPVVIRPLTAAEWHRAFAKSKNYDLGPYVEAVREMEGGVGYALTLNGLSATVLKRRMNEAAKTLDLTLRWAPARRDATELAVELAS